VVSNLYVRQAKVNSSVVQREEQCPVVVNGWLGL